METLAFVSYEKDKFKKTRTFVLNMMNMKPSVEGVQFPVSFHITALCKVFDPKSEKQKLIRYVPGEDSIYVDQQTPDDKVPKKKQTLTFVKGFLHIDPRETQLLEYIETCNENGSNTARMGNARPLFYELKMGNAAKQMNETTQKNIAALSWVYSASVNDIVNYAKILSVNVDRELDEIKWDLKIIAERDPVKFLDGFNNPNTKRKFTIINAVEKGVIKIDSTTGAITWGNGGTICVAPMGRAPIDYLVELSFNDQKGENTYLAICEAIRPKVEAVEKIKSTTTTSGIDSVDVLVDMAVEKGLIAKSGTWFTYPGHKNMIGKQFKKYLMENPELINEINSKLKLEKA